jgi:hypothetical protein
LFDTSDVMQQLNVISPLLVNFLMDGLQKQIINSLFQRYVLIYGAFIMHKWRYFISFILKFAFVRFGCEFILVARSKRYIKQYIYPVLFSFLRERGILLNCFFKVKFFSLREHNLDFLGYSFIYQEKWVNYYNKNL